MNQNLQFTFAGFFSPKTEIRVFFPFYSNFQCLTFESLKTNPI